MPPLNLTLHKRFVQTFDGLDGTRKERTLKALRKMSEGQFDGGLVVKKLVNSPATPVWESRVDHVGRIVFTFSSEDGIRCWRLLPRQHEAARTARRMDLSGDAWVEGDAEIVHAWNRPAPVDPADGTAQAQEVSTTLKLDLHASPPSLSAPWYLPQLDAYNALASTGLLPVELALSEEQARAARAPLPLLLTGSAGSGKTSVLLHVLRRELEQRPNFRAAFVSFNSHLVDASEKLFARLPFTNCDPDRVAFLTYDALLRQVARSCRGAAEGWHEFRAWATAQPDAHACPLPLATLWTEIRSVIKGGHALDAEILSGEDVPDLLPLDAYLDLPTTWSPVPRPLRPAVHAWAIRWHTSLREREAHDDQDVATAALRDALSREAPLYDLLVLDEAQDLTEKQLWSAILLSADGRVAVSGDPTQCLRPTRFTWRSVKNVLYRRGIQPEKPRTLSNTFRCTRETARLANALVDALKEAGQDEIHHLGLAAGRPGPRPSVSTLSATRRGLAPHPDLAVLVEDELTRDRLKEEVGMEYVWTVFESKGLEWEHVVLWDLSDGAALAGLPVSAQQSERQEDSHRRVEDVESYRRYLLRALFVGATRSRRTLTVATSEGTLEGWGLDGWRELVAASPEEPTPFSETAQVAASDWIERGHYYRQNEQWPHAEDCFRRGGDRAWEAACTVRRAIEAEDDAATRAAVKRLKKQARRLTAPALYFLFDTLYPNHMGLVGGSLRRKILRAGARSDAPPPTATAEPTIVVGKDADRPKEERGSDVDPTDGVAAEPRAEADEPFEELLQFFEALERHRRLETYNLVHPVAAMVLEDMDARVTWKRETPHLVAGEPLAEDSLVMRYGCRLKRGVERFAELLERTTRVRSTVRVAFSVRRNNQAYHEIHSVRGHGEPPGGKLEHTARRRVRSLSLWIPVLLVSSILSLLLAWTTVEGAVAVGVVSGLGLLVMIGGVLNDISTLRVEVREHLDDYLYDHVCQEKGRRGIRLRKSTLL